MHVEQVLVTVLEPINLNPSAHGKKILRWVKRNYFELLTHKKTQDPLFSCWCVFLLCVTDYEEIWNSPNFPKIPQEDLMRVFQWYNEIRPLNPMTHLSYSLHHLDLLFSVTSARCLMKVPLPSLKKLPSNSGVLPGPMFLKSEATLVKNESVGSL